MFNAIYNEIDYTDAIALDTLYESCTSIKKLIETINYSLAEFAPNLQLYFMIIVFDDLFNKNNEKSIERIFKLINIETIDINTLISMFTVLHYCNTNSLSSFSNFYNESKKKLNSFNIDIEKIK